MVRKFFIIAGEASGDTLGAKLMSELRKKNDDVEFYGVGGEKMQAQGIKSIFPMHELSLIGFVEILPHIPKLLKRVDEVVEKAKEINPDAVITIDAPAFNFRVAKKLQGSELKLVHYVAPTVWAYKPERAEKISKLYDHLLLLLPFEKPYFDEVNLPSTFIGHPITEDNFANGGNARFRTKHSVNHEAPVISMMIGSRSGEIKRLLPIFKKTIDLLAKDFPNLEVAILSTLKFEEEIKQKTHGWSARVIVVSEAGDKKDALAASTAALVKSGTGTIEVALAGVPMVVAYKVNPISAMMLKRMMRVEFVNLINIILGRMAIPEMLQGDCTPKKLAAKMKELLKSDDVKAEQLEAINEAVAQLRGDGYPSKKAAEVIMSLVPEEATGEKITQDTQINMSEGESEIDPHQKGPTLSESENKFHETDDVEEDKEAGSDKEIEVEVSKKKKKEISPVDDESLLEKKSEKEIEVEAQKEYELDIESDKVQDQMAGAEKGVFDGVSSDLLKGLEGVQNKGGVEVDKAGQHPSGDEKAPGFEPDRGEMPGFPKKPS